MRRRVTALGAAALVAGLVLFVGVAAAQEQTTANSSQERVTAQATIVTRNFTNSTPILIPSTGPPPNQASPYPSTIRVTDLADATIRDVNVKLRSYSHTFPDDVDVLLVGPIRTGKDALIMSDAGGGLDLANVTLTLDDEAPSPLPDGNGGATNPIVSGSYQPSDYAGRTLEPDVFPGVTYSGNVELSAFDRTQPNGNWRLYVVNDGAADTGQFARGWSLQITARVP
jgi:hypothetical protein